MHLSPSCNLTLLNGHALCMQTECMLHGDSLVSDFLTAPCYRLITSRTFTLVDLDTRATHPHPSPSRMYGPRALAGSTFTQNQSPLWTWMHEPSSHDLHPHPLGRMGHAPSLPCRRHIVVDSTQHTRMHAQVGYTTGYPRVFLTNPRLCPQKPVPATTGGGFPTGFLIYCGLPSSIYSDNEL
jgi:hypothetical protein